MKALGLILAVALSASIAQADSKSHKEGQPCMTSEKEAGQWVPDHGDMKCSFEHGLSKRATKPNEGEPCVTRDHKSGKWKRTGKHLTCASTSV